MREQAMIARRPLEKAKHKGETAESLVPGNPAVFGRDNDRHDRESGASGADEIVRRVIGDARAVPREPAGRMRTFPKKPERLALDEIKERRIRHTGVELDGWRRFQGG